MKCDYERTLRPTLQTPGQRLVFKIEAFQVCSCSILVHVCHCQVWDRWCKEGSGLGQAVQGRVRSRTVGASKGQVWDRRTRERQAGCFIPDFVHSDFLGNEFIE